MTMSATISRATKETDITCALTLDPAAGSQAVSVQTGLGFFDHMLTALATHAGFSLDLTCKGDTHIDDHHTLEDCMIVLGQAFDQALADRANLARFGEAHVPMDEALARASVDLVTRPYASIDLALVREMIGQVATENLPHGLESFAINARLTMHVDVLKGTNDHHKAEAAFKSLALALRRAVEPRAAGSASTKGTL